MNLPKPKFTLTPVAEITVKANLSFSQFDINSRIEELKERMSNDVYVMGELAIKGQITIFYAAPNTGKTLLMIALVTDAVKRSVIQGEDVIYINADDSLKGATTKAEILRDHGISNVTPGENGFTISLFVETIASMVSNGTANGKVIIVDTLKKFTDLMNKKVASSFMEAMRAFTIAGGTLIFLAHTNKHTGEDGAPIFQGTSDSLDDCDCAYTIQTTSESEGFERGRKATHKIVHFKSIKNRGDNAQEVDYEYTKVKGLPYAAMVESVYKLDENEAEQRKTASELEGQKQVDKNHIELVKACILDHENKKGQLIEALMDAKGNISKKKARDLLDRYDDVIWFSTQVGTSCTFSMERPDD